MRYNGQDYNDIPKVYHGHSGKNKQDQPFLTVIKAGVAAARYLAESPLRISKRPVNTKMVVSRRW